MGGIWSPPIKLLDGVWFGLDKGPGLGDELDRPGAPLSPDLGRNRLEVAPQPPGSAPIAAENIRLGSGAIDVEARATAAGGVFETIVETGGLPGVDLTIGHVVPGTARIAKVVLNGDQVPYHIRMGHRGQTVLVRAPSGKRHHLYVLIV